jgi:hypothetical protein
MSVIIEAEEAEMSQTLTLPDELYHRLRRAAEQEGMPIPDLLASWIDALPPAAGATGGPSADGDLLVRCTRALLNGEEPPLAVDWDDLSAAISATEPAYATVEDAMSALRRRSWVKDPTEC